MGRDQRISRRRVLRLAGGGSAVALTAGCLGTDGADRSGPGTETNSPNETDREPTNEGESARTDSEPAGNESDSEPAENETAEESAENETDGEPADEETDPQTDGTGTEPNATDADGETGGGSVIDANADIVVKATASGWEGAEPESIAGETNPTLVLEAGAEYGITWENADGKPHNIEIWDEQEEVVGEHATELVSEEGETQSIEFVASEEMVEYACKIHFDWGHRAPLEVVAPE